PVRADSGVAPDPALLTQCDMTADDASERKTGEVEWLVIRQDVIEPVGYDLRQALGRERLGRIGRTPHAGLIHRHDLTLARQRRNVLEPVRPGTDAAVHEDDRRARSPDAPRECSRAAGSVFMPRRGVEAGHQLFRADRLLETPILHAPDFSTSL